MREAQFQIAYDAHDLLLLRDIGPWDKYPTITNDAEGVVRRVAPILKGRRLLYLSSDDELTELIVQGGQFVQFAFPGQLRFNATEKEG